MNNKIIKKGNKN